MVAIAPFKGVMYNSEEIKQHGGLLVAPPYDVLSADEQKDCLDKHQHNILHIDYSPRLPDDPEKYTWHQRSSALLKKWLSEGVLTRLDKPALFHVETTCKNPTRDGSIVRHGIICLMKLEEFSMDSQVRPHEKTFSGHKEERLSLMKNTGANISQIFGFFPDENRRALTLMSEATSNKSPDVDFVDHQGFGHRVWIDQNEEAIKNLVETMNDRRVYIADGHHRYETALNYRRYIKETLGDKAPTGADYVMVYLCPMSDPGLVILPTHRLLHHAPMHPDEIINRLSQYFKISGKIFNKDNEASIRDRFITKLKKQKNSFGLYISGRKTYYILKLLESAQEEAALAGEKKELAALDTVILSNIVFRESFGLTDNDLDNSEIISYVSTTEKALEMAAASDNCAAFLLNPTTVEDILRVTEKGLIMPRKATYFYPKVTTGLVLNIID